MAHVVWRPRDRRKALLLAADLIGAADRLGFGLVQLDSANLAPQTFEPCASLPTARTILVRDVLGPCGWR
jgi:hypothetical protein